MKKGIIIIVIVILGVCILNIITDKITSESVSSLIGDLQELKENLELENNEEIKISMKKIEENWLNRKSKLEYFIEHDELEKVSSEIYIIKGNIEQEKYEDDVPEIENAKFRLGTSFNKATEEEKTNRVNTAKSEFTGEEIVDGNIFNNNTKITTEKIKEDNTNNIYYYKLIYIFL